MIKKTKNSLIIKTWLHNILCDLSFMYHPDSKRGKRPQYDEMLKIIHPIIIKEKLNDIGSEEYFEYKFAIEKSLRFIEEISKIDETKKHYYDIYYNNYFKFNEFEKFDVYEMADKFYCGATTIKETITNCNNLVHKFILYYNSYRDNDDEEIIEKPYYGFVDMNIVDINPIIKKLNL